MIKQTPFKHRKLFYHYRIHSKKLRLMPKNLKNLELYLYDMLENCPNEYFEKGLRSSELKFQIDKLKIYEINGHELCALTKQALNQEIKKTSHTKVQCYCLQNDNKTIAVEIPVWLFLEESEELKKISDSKNPLTGHIDLLRNEEGNIWVWDFKPKAEKEKFAATQVLFYTLMLSKRTKIPLKYFRCGYFDEKKAFIFEPKKANYI